MNRRMQALSPALIVGIVMLMAAGLAFFIHPWLTILILFVYMALTVGACFFPQTGFLGPVVSRGKTGRSWIALTFDDGPSEPTTRHILSLLDKYQMKATFFVAGIKARNHPDLIAEIVERGHSIGNHTFHHDPFLMMKSSRRLFSEIEQTQKVLRQLGIETRAFRPPVGIINPKLPAVLKDLKMICVIFSCRAFDAGNRRIDNLSCRILSKVRADDIVLLHDVPARGEADDLKLLKEIEDILLGLQRKGLEVVPLAKLLGMEVMTIVHR